MSRSLFGLHSFHHHHRDRPANPTFKTSTRTTQEDQVSVLCELGLLSNSDKRPRKIEKARDRDQWSGARVAGSSYPSNPSNPSNPSYPSYSQRSMSPKPFQALCSNSNSNSKFSISNFNFHSNATTSHVAPVNDLQSSQHITNLRLSPCR